MGLIEENGDYRGRPLARYGMLFNAEHGKRAYLPFSLYERGLSFSFLTGPERLVYRWPSEGLEKYFNISGVFADSLPETGPPPKDQ